MVNGKTTKESTAEASGRGEKALKEKAAELEKKDEDSQ